MRAVIIIWPDDAEYLVNELALLEGARWNRRFYDGPIDVLVMGPWAVVEPHIPQLSAFKYRFHNGCGLLRELERRYSRLLTTYPRFHFNAFMRWLVLDSFFQEDRYVAFDADLVLSSDVLSSPALEASSFTANSTCFVNINERSWLSNYREALTLLNDHPEAFADDWNKYFDDTVREPREPHEINEESFVRYLSKSGRIQNELPKNFDYWVTAMHLDYGSRRPLLQTMQTPVRYERTARGELLNDRPLAFVHFQWRFKEYLATYFLLKYVYDVHSLGRLEPWHNYTDGITENKAFMELQQKVRDFVALGYMGPEFKRVYTRRWIMEEFLFKRDFSEIFNDKHWHTSGFFA